jgi:hypothetical protein
MLSQLGWTAGHNVLDPLHYDNYKAITDTPAYVYLLSTSVRYPNSKYIYTTRDLESWLVSFKKWMEEHPVANKDVLRNRWVSYGCATYDEERLRTIYEKHDAFIRWYFSKYDSENLLEFPLCDKGISDKDKWDRLCTFMGVESPNIPILRLNEGTRS